MYASNYTCIAKFILNGCAPVGCDFHYHNWRAAATAAEHTKTMYACNFLPNKSSFTPS